MAYSFVRSITISHLKCGAGNSTDFPMLVSGTYTYLKTVGNGGDVTNSSGFDIVFASDITGSSLLKWETERYVAATGEVVFWVKIPTLSASVDTVIYMLYGNGSISTFQGDVNGTWNAAYRMVCHYPNGSSLTVLDSTSNAADGTVTGGVTAAVGQVDGGAAFNGTTGHVDSSGYSSNTASGTYEVWIKPVANGGVVVGDGASLSAPYFYLHTDSCLHAACAILNTPTKSIETVPNGSWAHIVCTFPPGVGNNKIYINGVECTYSDAGTAGGYANGFTGIKIGDWYNNTLFFNGSIDEIRISNSVRDANWILSSYNSQFDPASFYAVGGAVAAGGLFRPGNLSGLGSGGPFFQSPLL